MAKHDEAAFETFIIDAIAAGAGWVEGDPETYDRHTRLLPSDLWAFLEATQPEKVETLEKRFGSTYRQDVEKLIAKELDRRPAGVLRLLRHGIELRKGDSFEPDVDLRDNENVPLGEDIDDYVAREVLPYAADAWVDHDKTKTGYEIPFTRHFHVYTPPRPLEEIDAEIRDLQQRLSQLLSAER